MGKLEVPTISVLAKLGSIVVHARELLSDNGHAFDRAALQQLLSDPEVEDLVSSLDARALVPKTRPSSAPSSPAPYPVRRKRRPIGDAAQALKVIAADRRREKRGRG